VSQPLVEDETRPCPYTTPAGPCPGVMEAELDGQQVVWACTVCFGEQYGSRLPADEQAGPVCQMGVPEAMQQREPPSGGPVFLQIGRRPE
jgi:hypothetical protein